MRAHMHRHPTVLGHYCSKRSRFELRLDSLPSVMSSGSTWRPCGNKWLTNAGWGARDAPSATKRVRRGIASLAESGCCGSAAGLHETPEPYCMTERHGDRNAALTSRAERTQRLAGDTTAPRMFRGADHVREALRKRDLALSYIENSR